MWRWATAFGCRPCPTPEGTRGPGRQQGNRGRAAGAGPDGVPRGTHERCFGSEPVNRLWLPLCDSVPTDGTCRLSAPTRSVPGPFPSTRKVMGSVWCRTGRQPRSVIGRHRSRLSSLQSPRTCIGVPSCAAGVNCCNRQHRLEGWFGRFSSRTCLVRELKTEAEALNFVRPMAYGMA